MYKLCLIFALLLLDSCQNGFGLFDVKLKEEEKVRTMLLENLGLGLDLTTLPDTMIFIPRGRGRCGLDKSARYFLNFEDSIQTIKKIEKDLNINTLLVKDSLAPIVALEAEATKHNYSPPALALSEIKKRYERNGNYNLWAEYVKSKELVVGETLVTAQSYQSQATTYIWSRTQSWQPATRYVMKSYWIHWDKQYGMQKDSLKQDAKSFEWNGNKWTEKLD